MLRFRVMLKHLPAYVAAALLLCSCATDTSHPPPSATPTTTADGERVSTIPWNRPQRWESSGVLGSATGN